MDKNTSAATSSVITTTKSTLYKSTLFSLLAFSFCVGSAYAADCPQSAGLKVKKMALQASDKGDLLICTYATSDSNQPDITPASGAWNPDKQGGSLECVSSTGNKCAVNVSQHEITINDDDKLQAYKNCMEDRLNAYRRLIGKSGGVQVPVDLYRQWQTWCGGLDLR